MSTDPLDEIRHRLDELEKWRPWSDGRHRWADNEINRLLLLFTEWQREQRENQRNIMDLQRQILEVVLGGTKPKAEAPAP